MAHQLLLIVFSRPHLSCVLPLCFLERYVSVQSVAHAKDVMLLLRVPGAVMSTADGFDGVCSWQILAGKIELLGASWVPVEGWCLWLLELGLSLSSSIFWGQTRSLHSHHSQLCDCVSSFFHYPGECSGLL